MIFLEGTIVNPNLAKAESIGGRDPKFGVQILLPKIDSRKELDAAIKLVCKQRWGKKPAGLRIPIADGNKRGWEEYVSHDVFTATTKHAVNLRDVSNKPIAADEIYSGCKVRIAFLLQVYEFNGRKGVIAQLTGVQKLADGDFSHLTTTKIVPVYPDNIPQALKDQPNWLLWRFNAENRKIPLDAATGGYGSSTEPNTWRTFDKVYGEYLRGRYSGIGFALTDSDFIGVDLDDSLDEFGQTEKYAEQIINDLASYTEISPSGRGYKIVLEGDLPAGKYRCKSEDGRVEVYTDRRFFTITGNSYKDPKDPLYPNDPPKPIQHSGLILDQIAEQYLAKIDPREADKLREIKERLAELTSFDDIMTPGKRISCATAAMKNVEFDQGNEKDGSGRLLIYARCCKQWGLSIEQTIEAIEDFADGLYAFPVDYGPSQIAQRYDDAECEVGESLVTKGESPIKLPITETAPEDVSRRLIAALSVAGDAFGPVVRFWGGEWYMWQGSRYALIDNQSQIRSHVTRWAQEHYTDITVSAINNIMLNFSARVEISAEKIPVWVGKDPDDWPIEDTLCCTNRRINLMTGETRDNVPALFTLNSADFLYDSANTECPTWLKFLESLEIPDEDIRLLQQWFGYCLTEDTSQQKMFLLLGPTRAGKGVITTVLETLIGMSSCGATSFNELNTQFGLESAVGKKLIVFSDSDTGAGIGNQGLVTERIKSITGQDTVPIARKNKSQLSQRLNARLMLITNSPPEIQDSSGVIAYRTITVKLKKSFRDHEDVRLKDKLLAEISGILHWAVEGLQQLRANEGFAVTSGSRKLSEKLQLSMSPVRAFAQRHCMLNGSNQDSSKVYDVYTAYNESRRAENIKSTMSLAKFTTEICEHYSGRVVVRTIGPKREETFVGLRLKTEVDLEREYELLGEF